MGRHLPGQLEELRAFLPDLVAEARRTVPYCSALVTSAGGLVVAKGKTEERVNPVPPRPGIRITVWDGATLHSVATDRLSDRNHLLALTRDLASRVRVTDGPVPDPGPAIDRHFASACREDAGKVAAHVKQDICTHIFEVLAGTDDRVVNAQVAYRNTREYRIFCSPGRLLSSDVSNVQLTMVTFASDGTRQVMNYGFRVGPGHEATQLDDEAARKVALEALEHLGAGKIAPGEYRVILDPDMAGTLAHESFGHGCEMDTMMRGSARALLFIGRRVGSDLVNIRDEPGLPGLNGSIYFSDDGVVADRPVNLVEHGILQPTMMTDLYSFLMMRDRVPGLELSANGRLEAYDHPVYVRMTNTYFEPLPRDKGGKTLEELIADTGDGILVERPTSGMEDPLGWGVQIQAMRGREISKGRLSGRLFYKVGLTGYVPDVLRSVDGLGSELNMESAGTCGKGHKEYVRVSTGGPYVRCRMKLG